MVTRALISFVGSALLVFAVQAVKAETEISWTGPGNVASFHEVRELDVGELLPEKFSSTINTPCKKEQIRTETKDRLNIFPGVEDTYEEACTVPMSFGRISSDYLILDGHRDAFKKKHVNPLIIPVPNSKTVFLVNRSGFLVGGKLLKADDFTSIINLNKSVFGVDSYGFKSFGTPVKNGSVDMVVDEASLSISNNGRWLSGNMLNGKQFRLSTNSSSSPDVFGDTTNYNFGQHPLIKTSVTNDGRFVAVSGKFTGMNIFDVNACAQNPPSSDCRNNLGPTSEFLAGAGYIYLRHDFKEDARLQAYLNGKYRGDVKMTKIYNIFPTEASKQAYLDNKDRMKYLALGDSFASGEGAFNYRGGTDHPDNRCHQSLLAYPELISSEIALEDYGTVACSGAELKDISHKLGEKDYNEREQQSKGKEADLFNTEIYENFLPGYRQQANQVREHKPSIITLSISGNDIGFGDKIAYCLMPFSSCYESAFDRASIFDEIKRQFGELKTRIDRVKDEAADGAKIYLLGYPQFFPDGGGDNCELNTPFDSDERHLANDIVTDLNRMIEKVAAAAGVVYIDVQNTMAGHRLCEPGDKAFNGLTAGNDSFLSGAGPFGNESFHPNQLGHQLYKNSILAQTENFTKENPEPNMDITENDISSALLSELSESDAQKIQDIPEAKNNDRMAPDMIVLQDGGQFNLHIDENWGLVDGEKYDVYHKSTPTYIGSFVASKGTNSTLKLPDSIEPGYHTIHVVGLGVGGAMIDLYKVIFVAATSTDYDGDVFQTAKKSVYWSSPAA